MEWPESWRVERWLPARFAHVGARRRAGRTRNVAIEWDDTSARVMVARCQSGQVTVDDAFETTWTRTDDAPPNEEALAAQLTAALREHGIRGGEVLLTVPRGSIELKQLTVPPAPDDELPALVRFQAVRDFHALAEDWPLDFLPLTTDPNEPRSVLAAALNPESLWQLVTASRAAGLTPCHAVLRPCALAAAFLQQPDAQREPVRLLVDLLADDAELTVLVGDHPVFMRTTRHAADTRDDPTTGRAFLAELRRTLAAVHNQLEGRRVEAIYLCGAAAEFRALAERWSHDLSLTVRCFDPWATVVGSATRPARSERFGALIGLLAVDAQGAQHALDFLQPRRAPLPPNPRLKFALAGAAVLLLLLTAAGVIRWRLSLLDQQIADLQRANQQLDQFLKKASPSEHAVQALEEWSATDVMWLDELRWLAERLPPAQDAMLTQLRLGPATGANARGGRIELEGAVRVATVVDTLEQQLRDARHDVDGHGRQQDRDRKSYAWQFKSSVLVEPAPVATP